MIDMDGNNATGPRVTVGMHTFLNVAWITLTATGTGFAVMEFARRFRKR